MSTTAETNLCSEIRKLKSSKDNNTKSEEEIFEDEGIEVITPVSDELGQPLKWFRANPPNSDIKNQAEDEFRIRLLDLYIAHVSKTGETYFPPLEEKLRTRADFLRSDAWNGYLTTSLQQALVYFQSSHSFLSQPYG